LKKAIFRHYAAAMALEMDCGKRWRAAVRWTASGLVSCALLVAPALVGSSRSSPDQGPPGYTLERTGGPHDFDYFAGAWTTHQRRLKARGVGSTDWEEFPATLCMTPYLDGIVTVDELYFPTRKWAGVTVRSFDLERRQWSIYWISSADGRLQTPVVGGFADDRGEFYGEDSDQGRPVKVRYRWVKIDRERARWEQAFSYDDRTWETNWTADFTRADARVVCDGNRPRR
jgi:hypothetical protein